MMNQNSNHDQSTSQNVGYSPLMGRKFGFLGTGHMGQALIQALIQSQTLDPSNIWACNRTPGKTKKLVEQWGIHSVSNGEELIDHCDVIVIAVKPQDLRAAVESISSSFTASHAVLSLAAGVTLKSLHRLIPSVSHFARIMPNSPTLIQKGVVGYCLSPKAKEIESLVRSFLKPLGFVVPLEEGEEFEAFTVASSSGVGFVFELMMYWQEWLEEYGFDADLARLITVRTFLGASQLADQSSLSLSELEERVASKKGVTEAGLTAMRDLEVDRLLRISFEKAILRDRELSNSV